MDTLDQRLSDQGATRKELVDVLRRIFPHGHKDFLPLSVEELTLHSDKNYDYSKGGAALGNFDRVSAILALYPGLNLGDRRVVALVYALKQLDAVLWGIAKKITHKVEGLNDRLRDISVYTKIVMCMNTEVAEEKAAEDLRWATSLQKNTQVGLGESRQA